MSRKINDLICWYEDEICSHDRQDWEHELEESGVRALSSLSPKKTKLKTGLIDVDLVRGSTFPKTKPRHDLVSVAWFSLISVFLFPLRRSWWVKKTSWLTYLVGCLVYSLIVSNLWLYHQRLCHWQAESHTYCGQISSHELYEPILLFAVLIFLQCQIVAAATAKKSAAAPVKKPLPLSRKKSSSEYKQIFERRSQRSFSAWSCSGSSLEHAVRRSASEGCYTRERKSTYSNNPDILNLTSDLGSSLRSTSKDKLRQPTSRLSDLDTLHSNSDDDDSPGQPTTVNNKTLERFTSDDDDSPGQRTTANNKSLERFTSDEPALSDDDDCYCGTHSSDPESAHESSKESGHESLDERPQSRRRSASLSQVPNNQIGCTVWNSGEPNKVQLSALQIGSTIVERSETLPSLGYALMGIGAALGIAVLPLIFKFSAGGLQEILLFITDTNPFLLREYLSSANASLVLLKVLTEDQTIYFIIIINSLINRIILMTCFAFLLVVVERAFKRRFVTAKLFSQITSTRRSMRSRIPHFRLNKVRNIKVWLCVRSYLRKRGPQRSVDCIVSAAFIITLTNVAFLCYELLKEDDVNPEFNLTNCEVIGVCVSIGIFLMRYMTLASKINAKYRNSSVLLTEQINLYLQMEQKPEKKDQLLLANNVLKLASDLLKELETPFKISGLSANPILYNGTKLLILSAVSGVLSEMLGFKLKLYKVKLK